jgi:hypothetical protein
MSSKAWVITIEPSDQTTQKRIVENLSNRKKIAQIEDYLCGLYKDILTRKYPDTEIDEAELKSCITRHSGVSVSLDKTPYILRAELTDV